MASKTFDVTFIVEGDDMTFPQFMDSLESALYKNRELEISKISWGDTTVIELVRPESSPAASKQDMT